MIPWSPTVCSLGLFKKHGRGGWWHSFILWPWDVSISCKWYTAYTSFHNYRELKLMMTLLWIPGSVLEFFPSLAGGRWWQGSLAFSLPFCPCISPLGISLLPGFVPLPISTCQMPRRALYSLLISFCFCVNWSYRKQLMFVSLFLRSYTSLLVKGLTFTLFILSYQRMRFYVWFFLWIVLALFALDQKIRQVLRSKG